LILGIWLLKPNTQSISPSELYATNFSMETIDIVRGTENDSLDTMKQLLDAKQYEQCLPLLQQYYKSHNSNDNIGICMANSYSAIGKTKEAKEILYTILSKNNLYKEKAQWYLLLCALQDKNIEEVKSIYEQIPNQGYFKTKAKNIIAQLGK
jgi:hypothetical protein